MKFEKQAEELNEIIRKNNPSVYNVLSQRGKAIFFPKDGIVSQSAEAKGKKINATIGIALEDNVEPMRLSSIEKNILLDSKEIFPYASTYGKEELRILWKEEMKRKNPSLKCETSLPVVTNALTHALSIAGYLFVNDGDRIITPDKLWGNYRLIFEKAYGGNLDYFNTFDNEGFDINSFSDAISRSSEKIILLLNFPNNPSGYSLTKKEAEEMKKVIKEHAEKGKKIVAIIDDAYFGFFYEDHIFKESIFSLLANLHENVIAVKIDGATKESYAWGLRVGFITYSWKGASKEALTAMENKTAAAIRGSISNVSNLSQSLLINAMKSDTYEKEKKEKFFVLKLRYERVKKIIKNEKYKEFFSSLPFNSGYFMCIQLKNADAEKVRQLLLNKYDTGVISIGNMIRIAYSSIPENDIEKLFDNIYYACKEMKFK